MITADRLAEWADKIDNRIGPISGRDADEIAKELRRGAERIRELEAEIHPPLGTAVK